jgi:hypothetical protein
MNLQLQSWNGQNFSPNYNAIVVYGQPMALSTTGIWADVAEKSSRLTGRSYSGAYLTIQVIYQTALSDQMNREAEIKRWFQTVEAKGETFKKLVAIDLDDSNRMWQISCMPLSVVPDNNSAIIVLGLEVEPFWKLFNSQSIGWSISGSPSTQSVTVIGDFAEPIIELTPSGSKVSGFLYNRFVEVIPPTASINYGIYPLDVGGGINTAALVTGGKALASGDDFRLIVGNTEIPRWFGSTFNTASTKVWTAEKWSAPLTLTLSGAISNSGTITAIAVKNTAANQAAFAKMPSTGILKIGTERFTYTGKDSKNLKFTGITPAAKQTSRANHSDGDTIYWIQKDLWMIYGNSSADTPVQDNSNQPMFDLDTSTNTSWVYSQFYDDSNPRSAAWSKVLVSSVLLTSGSGPYTGSHGDVADPATEAGLRIANMQQGGFWRPETSISYWNLYCAAKFTGIPTETGSKYRASADWPIVQILVSADDKNYTAKSTIATPTASGVWQAMNITGLSFGGSYSFVQFKMNGSLKQSASNEADAEMQSVTMSIDSTNVPTVTVAPEQSAYYISPTITDNASGDAISFACSMKAGQKITINCRDRKIYLDDGTVIVANLNSNRTYWLVLSQGSNTLSFSDPGTVAIAGNIYLEDRVAV